MSEVVLVTGAGSGIGAVTCNLLLERGYEVRGWDLRTSAPRDRAYPMVEVDVTDDRATRAAWSALTETDEVVGLVNAAGIWRRQEIENTPAEEWLPVVDVNLSGTIRMCQLALRHMIERSTGAIVNVASMAAMRNTPGVPNAPYSAAKAGVVGLTFALSAEVAGRGVRVNAVAPGTINTPLLSAGLSAEQIASIAASRPAQRLGDPIEVARPIVFLLSEDASFVNGATLPVYGG